MADNRKDVSRKEALPEPRIWKMDILNFLFAAIKTKAKYFIAGSSSKNQVLKEYQGFIIGLYTFLKPKLTDKEMEVLKGLDDFTTTSPNNLGRDFRMGVESVLTFPYLCQCLDTLNIAVERMGITKIEKRVWDADEAVMEGIQDI